MSGEKFNPSSDRRRINQSNQVPRVVTNRLEGHKIEMNRLKQVQMLKNQLITKHFQKRVHSQTFDNYESQRPISTSRPRTSRVLTTAHSDRSKINKFNDDLIERNKTMMVTSNLGK